CRPESAAVLVAVAEHRRDPTERGWALCRLDRFDQRGDVGVSQRGARGSEREEGVLPCGELRGGRRPGGAYVPDGRVRAHVGYLIIADPGSQAPRRLSDQGGGAEGMLTGRRECQRGEGAHTHAASGADHGEDAHVEPAAGSTSWMMFGLSPRRM